MKIGRSVMQRFFYLTPIADIAALASSEHDEESALSPKMTAALAKELMIRQNEEFVEK